MQEKEDRRPENKQTTPLISVIVPIYNVEKYIRKCLESLKGQTLKEIEIICIDDGSTDRSGRIADEYAREDRRFRVIHTENRGLSAARNRGIDESRADWLMFVDADDWVDPRFSEISYETAIENNADLVCFRSYLVTRFGRIKKPKKNDAPIGIVDEMMAHKYGGTAVWNKLYKRLLFSEIRFPEGHVHEDLATAHRFVDESEKTILLPDRLYYYADRKGSISHTHTYIYRRDAFVSALNRHEFLIERGYSYREIECLLQKYAIGLLARVRPNQDPVYLRAMTIVDSIRGIPKEFTVKQKVALVVWNNKKLFYLICRMSRRLID